jgi:hypothetical protein
MEYTTIERYEPTSLDLIQESPVSSDPRVKLYSAQILYSSGEWLELDNIRVIAGPGEALLATELAGIFADQIKDATVNTVWCPADVRAEVFADDEF